MTTAAVAAATAFVLAPEAFVGAVARAIEPVSPSLAARVREREKDVRPFWPNQAFSSAHSAFLAWKGESSQASALETPAALASATSVPLAPDRGPAEPPSEPASDPGRAAPAAPEPPSRVALASEGAPPAAAPQLAAASASRGQVAAASGREVALTSGARTPASGPRLGQSRVLAIGDSMLKTGLADAIRDSFRDVVPGRVQAAVFARSATGLSRPDFFDWPETARRLVRGRSFDAIFVFLGANDAQGIQEGRRALPFGSDEWKSSYSERVREFVALLCASSKRVYWVAPPPMMSRKFDSNMKTLSETARAALPECARFLDFPSEIAGPDGGYASYKRVGGATLRVREKDGVHISRSGAELVARRLIKGYLDGF